MFVLEIQLGNLLNDSLTDSQLSPIMEEIQGQTFTVTDPQGNVIEAQIEDITMGMNQGKSFTKQNNN